MITPVSFSARIIRWQERRGRHDLPWQNIRDPYRIWISEIMLQQTQVLTVIPYYKRFLKRLPDIKHLAEADQDAVLSLWSGLGYYSRARNLHQAAGIIQDRFSGRFPGNFEDILNLPGIGRSTAGAISVFAFMERKAILDGNVKRVLCRYFAIGNDIRARGTENLLWKKSESLLPRRGIIAYTQGLMDLGASLCTRTKPSCCQCPLSMSCKALKKGMADNLPKSGKRKPLALKASFFLILKHKTRIVLFKRPAPGIWGGLWCLPETPYDQNPILYCKKLLGISIRRFSRMPAFNHSFTHFTLTIHPLAAEIPLYSPPPSYRWVTFRDALKLGLPAPIRKLISDNQRFTRALPFQILQTCSSSAGWA